LASPNSPPHKSRWLFWSPSCPRLPSHESLLVYSVDYSGVRPAHQLRFELPDCFE
jgi:hypothetical protein